MNVSQMWHNNVKITASSTGGCLRPLSLVMLAGLALLVSVVAAYAHQINLVLTILASIVVAAELAVIAHGAFQSRVPRKAQAFSRQVDLALAAWHQEPMRVTAERVAELEPAPLVIDHAALADAPWDHAPVDLDALTRER